MSDDTADSLGEIIAAALPGAVTGHAVTNGELVLDVSAADIVTVARFLRDDPRCAFVCFIDVTAVDWPQREQRFDVVYHLLSPTRNRRVRIKLKVDETTSVASLVDVFPGANWFEREVYDLYGLVFTGHPDLRRLLTDYGFEGHPLRKDFPLTGFVEVRWDDEQKRVVYSPVQLTQEFRHFDFLSPWEGPHYPALPGDEKASS
jgi:NADH-quinone oxidoreductase subunit C